MERDRSTTGRGDIEINAYMPVGISVIGEREYIYERETRAKAFAEPSLTKSPREELASRSEWQLGCADWVLSLPDRAAT